jgi:hypothetical protein
LVALLAPGPGVAAFGWHLTIVWSMAELLPYVSFFRPHRSLSLKFFTVLTLSAFAFHYFSGARDWCIHG